MSTTRYSPGDMGIAAQAGARCGHGALAAALGVPVARACLLFNHGQPWVGERQMRDALTASKRRFTYVGKKFPKQGVALLQWIGPWSEPGKPKLWSYRHRHWIAVDGNDVWDANYGTWLPFAEWRAAAPELFPKNATGWNVVAGIEIHPE